MVGIQFNALSACVNRETVASILQWVNVVAGVADEIAKADAALDAALEKSHKILENETGEGTQYKIQYYSSTRQISIRLGK